MSPEELAAFIAELTQTDKEYASEEEQGQQRVIAFGGQMEPVAAGVHKHDDLPNLGTGIPSVVTSVFDAVHRTTTLRIPILASYRVRPSIGYVSVRQKSSSTTAKKAVEL